jgi:dTDP-glucose 4,6-dehydratase
MNLLVTGGCGFIGSNFINRVHEKYRIVNVDALYYCARIENLNEDVRVSSEYTFVHGNLCELDLVSLLMEHEIDLVVHFAAQSHVTNSFSEPLNYTMDNIVGTHRLLEACRVYGRIQRFVHVSTDEVYGESLLGTDEVHKTERSVLCPTNPYAATKAGAEIMAQSYYHSFKMPIIITRGNNVYGPNQYPEKLIPKFITQLNRNERVTIEGTGGTVRAFLHVDDTVSAFELILERGVIGEIYNIGCDPGMEYSVKEIAEHLIRLIKGDDVYSWITYVPDRPYNDLRYYISNDKLRSLGWTIKVPFNEGIVDLVKLMST